MPRPARPARTRTARTVTAATLTLLLAACAPGGTPTPDPTPPDTRPEGTFTDRWTLQEALQMPADAEKTAQTTMPLITSWPQGSQKTLPDQWVWDTWPLKTEDMQIATVRAADGTPYYVLIHLSVDDSVLPGARHDLATLRYSYSTDGRSWQPGGYLFPEGVVLGSRNWAGSALLKADGGVEVYYTATGERNEGPVQGPSSVLERQQVGDVQGALTADGQLVPQSGSGFPNEGGIGFEQRIVLADGVKAEVVNGRVVFSGTWKHRVILRADGTLYQTVAQSDAGPLYGFRDPWAFRDPADGKRYVLFTGNMGGLKSQQTCQPEDLGDAAFRAGLGALNAEMPLHNGAVGLAVETAPGAWKLLNPLLTARCVNQELERPHLLMTGGKVYLFFSSHIGKFAPYGDLRDRGEEGLYGFVGDSLRGDYTPLNRGGLVLNTPLTQRYQSYSYDVLPGGLTTLFVDVPGIGNQDISVVSTLPPEQQRAVFGGTLGKTLKIDISGSSTTLVSELNYGQIIP